jgi:hypothetical protein
MNRSTFTALFLAAACASAPAPIASPVRDRESGAPPPPVASGGEILRLGPGHQEFKRPRPADEACLGEALRRAPGAVGVENKVRFAVLRDGSLARFSYLEPVTDEQRVAIEVAFTSCPWNPGLDPEGHPVAVWVIQPVRVLAPPPSP